MSMWGRFTTINLNWAPGILVIHISVLQVLDPCCPHPSGEKLAASLDEQGGLTPFISFKLIFGAQTALWTSNSNGPQRLNEIKQEAKTAGQDLSSARSQEWTCIPVQTPPYRRDGNRVGQGGGGGEAGRGGMPWAHSLEQPRPPFQRLYIPASVCYKSVIL